jgi:hypothetical protein
MGALYNFKLANLSEIYKFRAELALPAPLRYSIGLLYPITLTKLTLFTPCWLLFLLLLSRLAEAKTSVILSLLLPMLVGVAWMLVSQFSSVSSPLMQYYVGIINSRMIAMPSVALEVYNNFFSTTI